MIEKGIMEKAFIGCYGKKARACSKQRQAYFASIEQHIPTACPQKRSWIRYDKMMMSPFPPQQLTILDVNLLVQQPRHTSPLLHPR